MIENDKTSKDLAPYSKIYNSSKKYSVMNVWQFHNVSKWIVLLKHCYSGFDISKKITKRMLLKKNEFKEG